MKSKRNAVAVITSSAMLATVLAAAPVFADTNTSAQQSNDGRGMGRPSQTQQRPGVFGTVTAISGTTLRIESTTGGMRPTNGKSGASSQSSSTATTQTYTVDAANATVSKAGSASTFSAISVGDRVMIEGTVSGTNVAATAIRDGQPSGERNGKDEGPSDDAAMNIKGTGQPVVGGTVSSINGSSLSITNEGGASYTIDASGAAVVRQGATSTVSAISAGDRVVVQGSVNGSTVTATSVIDQGAKPADQSATSTNSSDDHQGPMGRALGFIGNFFHRVFGFF